MSVLAVSLTLDKFISAYMVIFQITPKLVTDIRKEFLFHSLAEKVVPAEFFNFNLIFRLAWVGSGEMHKSSSRGM